jgi:hypothetical protein
MAYTEYKLCFERGVMSPEVIQAYLIGMVFGALALFAVLKFIGWWGVFKSANPDQAAQIEKWAAFAVAQVEASGIIGSQAKLRAAVTIVGGILGMLKVNYNAPAVEKMINDTVAVLNKSGVWQTGSSEVKPQ